MAFAANPDLTVLAMYFKSANQGWSERHYLAGASAATTKANAIQLCDYRLALLPPTCSLVYAKTSRLDRDKDSIPLRFSYPAAGTFPGDPFTTPAVAPPEGSVRIEVSQIAVLMRLWNVVGNAASRWIHGIPDNRVTAEVLTDALLMSVAAPPAVNTLTAADSWPTRFGYYMYLIKQLCVLGRKKPAIAGVPQWQSDTIDDMMVAGISVKKTGRPFRQRAGHVPVG